MASGVSVNESCLEIFQELKLRKKYKYLVFKLSDDNKEIILEKAVEQSDYQEFIDQLPKDSPRYAVYDFEYQKTGEGEGERHKLVFYSWTPDVSKIKQKMLYASSKDALRKQLVGISTEIQGTDLDEVQFEAVLEKVSKSSS
ncbi:hypothetical protein BC937DRAFT_95268 [Endogone sp. FLAS-F59071]|nr:hypothetical protein BC937DRAFT_95268 [Endogone sp. FLAS-F59071]|eukprot:RUS13465.1 hypothetical protein BC937DRAFT_95268 [Endogone sp. FLAS-F59071]